jgi:hypothetical protein
LTHVIKTQQLILMESILGILTWLQDWKQQMVDKEEATKFVLCEEELDVQKESGKVHIRRTMLQLINESCNPEHFNLVEAPQADFEATLAHGIGSSDNRIIIMSNTL